MSDFERNLVGDIPLHEAAAFFVEVKRFGPHGRDEMLKSASVRIRSRAQEVISDLLEGRMPEGKAGYFKTAAVNVRPAGLTDRAWFHEYYSRPDYYEGLRKLGSTPARFRLAMRKLGFEGQPSYQTETAPALAESNQDAAPETQPTPAPEDIQSQGQFEPPQPMPANYLGAERAAQEAQEANEANFYRDRLSQVTSSVQAAEQRAQQAEQQVQQLQQQADMAGQQVQQVQQQAVEANDRALTHSQEAANMRMAIQQLRDTLMQLASQDPQAIAQAQAREESEAQMAQQQQAQEQAQMGAGAPAAAPAPGGGAPPTEAPGGAGGGGAQQPGVTVKVAPPNQPAQEKAQSEQQGNVQKTSSVKERLLSAVKKHGPYALAGIGAGTGVSTVRRMRLGARQEQAQKAEEEATQGGYMKALQAAKAQAKLRDSEIAQRFPVKDTLASSALGGALVGIGGPGAVSTAKAEWPRLVKNIRRIRGR